MVAHCLLEKIHSGKPLRESFRCKKHDHSRTAADQNGVNKHSESLSQTYLCRMIRLCCCSRAGGGTGACLIGKQSSLDTIHKNSAKSACHNLTETKSLLEDPSDHRRDHAEIDHDQKNSDQKITACHDGNHNIQNLYGGIFAKNDHRCQNHQGNSAV